MRSSVVAVAAAAWLATAAAAAFGNYLEPALPVTRLLTAEPPPLPLVHARSRSVALLHRQPLVPLAWLARPYLGLAGYRFDPETRTSRRGAWIQRVEVVTLAEDGSVSPPSDWIPPPGSRLEDVSFAPDGRHLAATLISTDPVRLALFDVETGEQRVLPAPINDAWGSPCSWVANDALLCRLVPENLGPPPAPRVVPLVVEHFGPPEPARTYPDLLEDAQEDAQFEHYFSVEMARVGLDGTVRRLPEARGLLADIQPSLDGKLAVFTRIVRPYSRLVPASRFPRSIELWDLAKNTMLASRTFESKAPWHAAWMPTSPATIGWIEQDPNGTNRWMAQDALQQGPPQKIVSVDQPIEDFGWTTAGTPHIRTISHEDSRAHIMRVVDGRAEELWSAATEDRYGNPGRALRQDGQRGPVLEIDGRIFVAGDGLAADGPEPFLEAVHLNTGKAERIFTSDKGVFEPVLGILATDPPWLITSRETDTEPPNLFSVRIADEPRMMRRRIRPLANPYPDLEGIDHRRLSYERKDGVALSATLYLPAVGTKPFPTLVWIYPREYSAREFAEQVDVRAYRFPEIKGPSPLAAVLQGYAVVINPTMPIVGAAGRANDQYVAQLVANAEAVVEHLVASGVAAPERIAIGGRSYGAFSTANLLAHTQLFRTGVALSGAYNRTLTPFGFQHEKRSFWKETDLYTRISPFFYADQVDEPLLLVHGGADSNPGTPPEQSKRFLQALIGNGASARFVELPHEDHVYAARENVLHAAAEMLDWLDRTMPPPATPK